MSVTPGAASAAMAGAAIGSMGGAVAGIGVMYAELNDIANRTFAKMVDAVDERASVFQNASAGTLPFGQDPLGQEMAETTAGAYEVFSATVAELRQILEQYRANLLQVAEEFSAADDSASADMLARLRELNAATVSTSTDDAGRDYHNRLLEAESREYREHRDQLAGPSSDSSGVTGGGPADGAESFDGAGTTGGTTAGGGESFENPRGAGAGT